MKYRDKILRSIAKLSLNSAKTACGAASWFDCYQPKEPENLLEKFKKK